MNAECLPEAAPGADVPFNEGTALDALVAIAENVRLLIVGPLIVGLLAYAVTFALPKTYTSVAFLGPLDQRAAGLAESLIRSPRVLDSVIRKIAGADMKAPMESQRSALNSRIKLQLLRASDSKIDDAVLKLEASDISPERSRTIATALIDAWLAASQPGPEERVRLERSLESFKKEEVAISSVISDIRGSSGALLPGLNSDHPLTNFADLIKARIDIIWKIEDLTKRMAGASHDLVLAQASLPDAPVWPIKWIIALYAMAVAFAVLVAYVLIRNAVQLAAARPSTSAKVKRILAAITPWGSS